MSITPAMQSDLVLRITTAYEQGFGHAHRDELNNPYGEGTWEYEAWDNGRETGRQRLERIEPPEPAAVPNGWKLLKDSTSAERAWTEDFSHDNGHYMNACLNCGRMFEGHKRRHVCKVCAGSGEAAPAVRIFDNTPVE